jgi:hypothetical protein
MGRRRDRAKVSRDIHRNAAESVLSLNGPAHDAKILRAIKTLEKINGKPAAEFWKDVKDE